MGVFKSPWAIQVHLLGGLSDSAPSPNESSAVCRLNPPPPPPPPLRLFLYKIQLWGQERCSHIAFGTLTIYLGFSQVLSKGKSKHKNLSGKSMLLSLSFSKGTFLLFRQIKTS